MNNGKILLFVIDDDVSMLEIIESFIASKFPMIEVISFRNGEDAIRNIAANPKAVIIDYYLDNDNPDAANGLEILKKFKKINPALPVIMFSAQDKPEVAAEIVKAGAFSYIVKNESSFERMEIVLKNLTMHVILNQRIITQRLLILLLGLSLFFSIAYLVTKFFA
ncbi:MAG: response regulator [Bacteroidia bacterium]|nr:response regulator [Bacteroidia bacterium]